MVTGLPVTIDVAGNEIMEQMVNITVKRKPINIKTAEHTKEFDGTPTVDSDEITAELDETMILVINGVLDYVGILHGSVVAAYPDVNVGEDSKWLDISDVTLTGTNYMVNLPVRLSVAGITPIKMTLDAFDNKQPDPVEIIYGTRLGKYSYCC